MNRSGTSYKTNKVNWTFQFNKLNDLISSALMIVRGTIGSERVFLLSTKWRLTKGGTRFMITQGVVWQRIVDLIDKKKRKLKTRAKI
jgi:hypothetical protein